MRHLVFIITVFLFGWLIGRISWYTQDEAPVYNTVLYRTTDTADVCLGLAAVSAGVSMLMLAVHVIAGFFPNDWRTVVAISTITGLFGAAGALGAWLATLLYVMERYT